MVKKQHIGKSDVEIKPIDQISVIQSESLADLSPRFKNDVLFDLLSTELKQSKYDTEEFHQYANAAKCTIEALDPKDSIQLIVAAQIASLHKAQQNMLMFAHNEQRIEHTQTLTNLAIKLSNTLIQQITLMHKLKNGHQQKVVIEHVSINGGQAVIGTVNTTPTTTGTKT
jgi:hypothetical protein